MRVFVAALMLLASASALPFCDLQFCERESATPLSHRRSLSPSAARLPPPLAGVPKRHTNVLVRLFSRNHYCSTPTAFKALRCVVKGASGRGGAPLETTYAALCKDGRYVTLVEPVDKRQRANVVNQAKLAARKAAQQSTLGVVLQHSSPNSRSREMFCEPVDDAHALTVGERKAVIASLSEDVLASPVYNSNDAPLHAGVSSGPDLTTVFDLFLGAEFAQAAPQIAGKAAEAVAACKAATARRADLTCASGVATATPAKGCRNLLLPVSISGIAETATISCADGVVKATVVARGSVVQATPCHLAATEIALTPAWADAAVALALAHEARNAGSMVPDKEWQTQRSALEKLTLASRGIPHALRPFAWEYLLRDRATWPESGLRFNPDHLPLQTYMDSLAESALEDCAKSGKTASKEAPCPGVYGIYVDANHVPDNVFAHRNPYTTESVRALRANSGGSVSDIPTAAAALPTFSCPLPFSLYPQGRQSTSPRKEPECSHARLYQRRGRHCFRRRRQGPPERVLHGESRIRGLLRVRAPRRQPTSPRLGRVRPKLVRLSHFRPRRYAAYRGCIFGACSHACRVCADRQTQLQ